MADEKPEDKDTEEKVLERARKRWKQAEEAERDNRVKEADDIKFAAASPDDNFQWPQDVLNNRQDKTQEGGPRPCLTINPLPTHIRQVVNEQRMNRPQIKVRPADDMGDVKVAKVYDGLFRHIQVASEADLSYDNACEWQVAGGEGFFRIFTEFCDERSFDQDIVIAPIADRFKVYLDPIGLLHHPAGKKCKWGFIVEDVPKEDYEADYDDKPIDWTEAGKGDMIDWFPGKDTVRIAEYFEIRETPDELYLWANDKTSLKSEPRPPDVTAVEKPKKTRKTRVPVCVWRKLNGQHVLKTEEMPTKYIPIVRVVGNQWIVEGKPIVSGLTRNAKDAVRMYNYNASMEVELNSLAPRAPITAMVEQIKGHEDLYRAANRLNLGVLPYNAVVDEVTGQIVNVQPPQRMQPVMPQVGIIEAKRAAADDIKKTTGQYDPSLGNNPQSKSGIALQREQVKSEVGTFHYVDNLARALRYAGCIMLDMAPKVYTGKRVLRILGEDGEPDHALLDPSIDGAVQEVRGQNGEPDGEVYRLDYGKYDLVVTTGPSFTTKRQEASEFLTNAIGSAKDPVMAQVLTYLALKSNDWAGAEEATEMVKKLLPKGLLPPEKGKEGEPPQIPPEVQQAMDQAKQMAGHMKGQLDAAAQALAERDKTLQSLEGQVKAKNVEALAKMYEADKKAMSEIEKARAEVTVAHANAVVAAAAQPENGELQGVIKALGQLMSEMQQKIDGLTASSAQIAEQLQTFEISSRMPSAPPVAPATAMQSEEVTA